MFEVKGDLQIKEKLISQLKDGLVLKQAQLSPVPVKKESSDAATQFNYSGIPAKCKPERLHAMQDFKSCMTIDKITTQLHTI